MADVGTGTTVTFGTSGFTASIIGSIENDGIERGAIDVTNHGSATYREYIPTDLVELGEMTFEFLFDPNEQPPITAAAETITFTFPIPAGLSNGATLTITGFLMSWKWESPLEEAMTAEGTIKPNGGTYTWADAS